MKTKDAIELAGSAAELSRILKITQSAVCQWGENVPELSLFRLKTQKPKWFKKPRTPITTPATPEVASHV